MELQLVRHLWGVSNPLNESTFSRFREKGYQGVELFLKAYVDQGAGDAHSVRDLCDSQGFYAVLQAITSGDTVEEHLNSLRAQLKAAEPLKPVMVNIHSGRDGFTEEQSLQYFEGALKIEAEAGIPCAHETHRGRILYNPWTTRRVLEAFPDLKLTCDYSHFVCVCERLLETEQDILRLCAEHCHHLHARVGHQEGPQVSDPRAPEFAREVKAHEQWWDWIWESQAKRGYAVTTLTPEFGPPTYQQALPYTGAVTANLEDICDWMAARQKERFAKSGLQG